MANLAADLASVGFASGAGITPGRLLRVAHSLTRATIMTLGGAQLTPLRLHCSADTALSLVCRQHMMLFVLLAGGSAGE
jgi:hypothetical protein